MLRFFLGHDSDKRNNKKASQHASMAFMADRDFREPVRTVSDFGGVIVISPMHAINQ